MHRFMMLVFGLSTFAPCLAAAQQPRSLAELRQAARAAGYAVERAEMKLRHFRLYEFPAELERIEDELELAEIRREAYRRRVAHFEPYQRIKYGNPFAVSLEAARLKLLETEQQIDRLQQARRRLWRTRGDRIRLLEIELRVAVERFKQLDKRLKRLESIDGRAEVAVGG